MLSENVNFSIESIRKIECKRELTVQFSCVISVEWKYLKVTVIMIYVAKKIICIFKEKNLLCIVEAAKERKCVTEVVMLLHDSLYTYK